MGYDHPPMTRTIADALDYENRRLIKLLSKYWSSLPTDSVDGLRNKGLLETYSHTSNTLASFRLTSLGLQVQACVLQDVVLTEQLDDEG